MRTLSYHKPDCYILKQHSLSSLHKVTTGLMRILALFSLASTYLNFMNVVLCKTLSTLSALQFNVSDKSQLGIIN